MSDKKFNFNDDFEMLYLRHEYIEKAGTLDGSLVQKYANIVNITSKIMFDRLVNFEKVGFTIDDIISITNIYMLIYMNLYSIQYNPKELEIVLANKKVLFLPKEEIERVDRNRLIKFLRQKLHHCGVLCARKSRNIMVGKDKRGIFAYTSNSLPVSKDAVLDDCKKYGYRKVTKKEYKEAVAKGIEPKDVNGFSIFTVDRFNSGLLSDEYKNILESSENLYYKSPEDILERQELENKIAGFQTSNPEEKKKILKKFIRQNQNDWRFKKEIVLARKMLSKNKTMV